MKIGHSWRNVALLAGAFTICVMGPLWKPEGLIARTPAANPPAPASPRAAGRSGAGHPGQPAQEAAAKKVTAGDAYMNVQVLKDIPSDQLVPSMRYITVALGVSCDFCHEPKSFDSDDKPEKVTARKMMTMMLAINKDNFNGRREVTCYTCHHGVSKAANTPTAMAVAAAIGPGGAMPPPNAGPAGPPAAVPSAGNAAGSAAPMPTIDDILAKYAEALGGSAALEKITTLSEKGTTETPARGMKAAAEVFRKAPNKAMAILHAPAGDVAEGFNGTTGWQQRPGHGVQDVEGDELVRTKLWAAIIPGLNLKQDFARAQVAGIDKIGDRDAYRVIASRAGGGQVRFYFDKDSGLLLRVSERIESFLGALPQETNYSDYRDVSGVKLPFSVIVAHGDGPTIYKWEHIQANVPVDDARFEKPAEKAAQ
jgi:photosynthetic reaction center cytochrome c subunit